MSYAVASYSGSPSTSEQSTVTASTGAGDAVVVAVGAGTSGTPTGVTDSKGNTYTLLASDTAQIGTYVYQGFTNTPLASGTDWIKVTYSGTAVGQQWIARGQAGINGADVTATAHSASSTSPALTSASLAETQEWAIAFLANGNAAGTPTSWTGGFTAEQTVSSSTGAFYTFADQITTDTDPLQPGATLSTAKAWALVLVSLKFSPVYKIGSANSTGSGSSLSIPVTTGTQPGDAIAVFAKQLSATVTSVTDSRGNAYTIQQSNAGNSFDVTTATATGTTNVGAAYSKSSYSSTTEANAANETDTWLNGGTWPTPKLTPRTMAYNVIRKYYSEGAVLPTSSAGDGQDLAGWQAIGCKNACITIRAPRDGTNNYTGSTFTSYKATIGPFIAYALSVFPNAKFTLWHEANSFGVHGPFGDGSSVPSLGSPYGSGAGTVSTSQMYTNWQSYVQFYGAAIHSALSGTNGQFWWMASMDSPNPAIDFFDVALNSTQQGWYNGVGTDYYVSSGVDQTTGLAKATLTQPYGQNNVSLLGLATKYSLPFGMWEVGAGTGRSTAQDTFFVNSLVTAPLVSYLASGGQVADIIWWNYGGDTLNGSTAPALITAVQNLYDSLQGGGSGGATTALQAGDTITVNWSAGANTKFAVAAGLSLATTGQPDQKVTASGTSATPSATTGTLAQANEVAFAYCSDSNASGAISWAGGWTTLASDQTGSSTFQSLAYKQVSSTSAVTASGTIVSGAWDVNLITFPVTSQAVQSGMVVPKPSMAGTGSVPTGSITGTGSMAVPKVRMSSGGAGTSGTPYLIGSNTSNGVSTSIFVSTSVNAGDSIQVGVVVSGTGSVPTVGPDSAGNTYTQILTSNAHGDATFFLFECDGANPLTEAQDNIPVLQTISGTIGAVAIGDNGVFAGDKAVIAAGSSTAPSSGSSGTLSQMEEHAIAWIVDAQAGGVPTWASPWSSHVLANVDANSTTRISAAYQIVGATTALTASGTITSADWACAVTTLEVTPATITTTLSNGVVGVPYLQTPEFSGGQPPVAWSVVSGSIPGVTLSSGVFSGVPTTAGDFTITYEVTDALGQVTSSTVTVIIASGASGAAPMSQLSNNLFAPSDSDFEDDNFTWSGFSNAASPFQTEAIALTGDGSLGWASLSDGPTSIIAGAPASGSSSSTATGYAVNPGPCIMSGALWPAQSGSAQLGVQWLDVNGNIIETDFGPVTPVTGAMWGPLAGAFTAPPGTVLAQPIVSVAESNAGDTNFIDMMFFAQAGAQVLVDWTNPPFSPDGTAGSSFMDVSPWLRLDGNGITYTIGRQDAISEIQPGSGSFVLQNDSGEFARDSSVSLPAVLGGAVTLQCRAQVNFADETGAWHTRFDGNISEVDYDFENTGNTSQLTVSLTDILAYLNRQDPLFCWTKAQVLTDGPLYHWSLDDAGASGGAGVAAETSGNNGPPLRLVSSDSTKAATVSFQDTSAGVETLADAASATGSDSSADWSAGSNQPSTPLRGLDSGNVGPFTTPIGSPAFTPVRTAQSAQNTFIGNTGYELVGSLPSAIAPTATGSDFSVEAWFMADPSIGTHLASLYGPYVVFGLGSSKTFTNLLAGLFLSSGTLKFECATYSQPPAFLGLGWPGSPAPTATASTSATISADANKVPHHLVVTLQGDPVAPVVTAWLDGNQIGSGFTLPTGQTYDTITIGGAYGGCGAFYGNISLASVYDFALAPAQITQHAMLGQYGMWEQTTDDCIAQIATYASVPGFWNNLVGQHAGLTMTEYMDITGANAIAAMQQFEQAEHGLLFAGNDGSLSFHTRSWRMGYGAPDLHLPEDSFDGGNLQYKIIDQFMVNEEGISGPNTLGATATTLLANPSTGQTQAQTTTSSLIQAGFTNPDSQQKYGTYAQNPVSSPLSLPLITFSRGFAALGLPAFSYWADPQLSDRAGWDANSRSEPWALPASVVIDLLTLNPNTGLVVSDFYGLAIDNMIAPTADTLPPSFPDAQTSVEWFIEGVTETYTLSSHTLQLYTSPAEPQRAWKPGDATYGVLGDTARIGISTADTNAPQAYGKSVSHDAGAPYWPPTFSAAMNDTSAHGFVGASDIRGIAQSLQAKLQPPMLAVGAQAQTQSFTNGALTGSSPPNISTLFWDTIFVDTTGGMGAVPGWPAWYLVTVAGYYEIDASVVWATTASQAGYTAQGWIVVAQAAAQAIAAGIGTPLTVNQYVRPIGESVRMNSVSMNPVTAPTVRMYLGAGDMVAVSAEENYTAARSSGTALGGSIMSLRFVGYAVNDDRTLINTSLGSGGSVSLVSHGAVQQATFPCTHTYSYRGRDTTGSFKAYSRTDTDGHVWQGLDPAQTFGGSRASQMAFNYSSIVSTLTGHTILSATLTTTNISTENNFATMLLGWTSDTPGKTTWNPSDNGTQANAWQRNVLSGQSFTFTIPVSLVKAFVNNSAKALTLGNGIWVSKQYFGLWKAGPSSWTLTVNYV